MTTELKTPTEEGIEKMLKLYNAVMDVDTYSQAITMFDVKTPNPAPDWWWGFENKWAVMAQKVGVNGWLKTREDFLYFPKKIILMDTTLPGDLNLLETYLSELVDDPLDEDLKNRCINKIKEVKGELEDIDGYYHMIITAIANFSTDIQVDMSDFDDFAENLRNEAKEDKDKIKELNDDIKGLKKAIDAYNEELKKLNLDRKFYYLSLSLQCFLYNALFSSMSTDPYHAQEVAIKEDIENLGKSIANKLKEIADDNALITAITSLLASITSLGPISADALKALDFLKEYWQPLDDKMHEAIQKFEDAQSDIKKVAEDALKDVQDGHSLWNDIVELAKEFETLNAVLNLV